MRCFECGAHFVEQKGDIMLPSLSIGNFSVDNVKYGQCPKCDQMLFPVDTVNKIERIENEELHRRLANYSVSEFINAEEASKILGMTIQDFRKNRRIQRGFIYSFRIAGKKLYLKESVLLYKEKADGRFELRPVNNIIIRNAVVCKVIPEIFVESCERCPNYRASSFDGNYCNLKKDWVRLEKNDVFDKDCPLQDYLTGGKIAQVRGRTKYAAILDDYAIFPKESREK